MYEPFVTGSQAYGTPRDDSDIDIVILDEGSLAGQLRQFADSPGSRVHFFGTSLKFGKLNLILCDRKQYNTWMVGTDILKQMSPCTRAQAIEVFDKLFGIKQGPF